MCQLVLWSLEYYNILLFFFFPRNDEIQKQTFFKIHLTKCAKIGLLWKKKKYH